MKIIDSHAHIYPDKIASRAGDAVSSFYDLPMTCVGSVQALLDSGKKLGVEKYIVHSVAMSPERVVSINNFIADACSKNPCFIGFMTLHQDLSIQEMKDEIDRCIALNLKGIKMHPDMQKYFIDSEQGRRVCIANDNRLPILLHTGDDRYEYSAPARLANLANDFANTKFIGAHFGGYSRWNELDCYLDTKNVWFDTSSSLFKIGDDKALELINKFGHKRFFFGTDFPMASHVQEFERFEKLKLPTKIKEDILYNNITEFLNSFEN